MDARRSLPTLGLVVLLVLDLALVVWALWPASTSGKGSASSSGRAASGSASPSPSGSASTAPSASPSADAAPAPARPVTRVVAGAGGRVVWVAATGSCDDPGSVSVSRDGGATWSSAEAPGAVTRIRPTDARVGFVVGGDEQCRLRLWNTSTAGSAWTDARSAADAWGRDPDDATRVHRPGGEPVEPCRGDARVLDLFGLRDGVASAVCSDGTLRTTTDGGARWTTTFTREGLVAVSLSGAGRGAVALVTEDCTGVGVARVADGALGEVQCLEDATPRAGQVSLSVVEGAVWLVAGDSVLRAGSANASTGRFSVAGSWPRD